MNSNATVRFVDQTLAAAQSDKDKDFYTTLSSVKWRRGNGRRENRHFRILN